MAVSSPIVISSHHHQVCFLLCIFVSSLLPFGCLHPNQMISHSLFSPLSFHHSCLQMMHMHHHHHQHSADSVAIESAIRLLSSFGGCVFLSSSFVSALPPLSLPSVIACVH